MCLFPVHLTVKSPQGVAPLTVACGKCLECERQRSLEWSFRIMQEASQYQENCFITLTYNDDNLPENGSVSRREVTLFMKSLRSAIYPRKVRFFACGEYGSVNMRPHYHLIIFNWFPNDIWYWQTNDSGDKLYRSPLLEKIWCKGYSTVGKVDDATSLYCAKYMNKIAFDKRSGLTPPFIQMSNRPGIGYNSAFSADLVSGRIYCRGKSILIPRYYLKVLEREGVYLEEYKERKKISGQMKQRSPEELSRRIEKSFEFLSSKLLTREDVNDIIRSGRFFVPKRR